MVAAQRALMIARGRGRTPRPPEVPGLRWFVFYNRGSPGYITPTVPGNVLSMTQSGSQSTVVNEAAVNNSGNSGQYCTLANATAPTNNGTFKCFTFNTTTTVTLVIPGGVTENPTPATYRWHGSINGITDLSVQHYRFVSGMCVLRDDYSANQKLIADAGSGSYNLSAPAGAASAFDGHADSSFAVRFVCPFVWSGNIMTTLGTATLTEGLSLTVPNTTTVSMARKNAGGTSTWARTISPALVPGTWYTVGWRYTAATTTLTAFVDGVNMGDAFLGVTKAFTANTNAWLMSNGTTGANPIFYKGWAGANAAWSDADMAAVHAAFLAYDAAFP